MIFGIDFDGTFNSDPELFHQFVTLLRSRGHDAVCVTGRSDDGNWGQEVRDAVGGLMPIVFAGLSYKREAAAVQGYLVDVWIDDWPEYIGRQNSEIVAHKISCDDPRAIECVQTLDNAITNAVSIMVTNKDKESR